MSCEGFEGERNSWLSLASTHPVTYLTSGRYVGDVEVNVAVRGTGTDGAVGRIRACSSSTAAHGWHTALRIHRSESFDQGLNASTLLARAHKVPNSPEAYLISCLLLHHFSLSFRVHFDPKLSLDSLLSISISTQTRTYNHPVTFITIQHSTKGIIEAQRKLQPCSVVCGRASQRTSLSPLISRVSGSFPIRRFLQLQGLIYLLTFLTDGLD